MMFFPLDDTTPQLGLMEDEYISFNVKRSDENHSPFPREVVLIPQKENGAHDLMIIPGIQKKEKGLMQEIQEIVKRKNWELMERHAFKIKSNQFSFLWRFRPSESSEYGALRFKTCLDEKQARQIQTVRKKYQDYLNHTLTSGQLFLIPDRDVSFARSNTNRYKQRYARPVLILTVKKNEILFAPLSTKIRRLNPAKDILIDSKYRGEALNPDEAPAVDNFPNAIFRQKTAIMLSARQQQSRKRFLDTVLMSMGSVRKELLHFIHEHR